MRRLPFPRRKRLAPGNPNRALFRRARWRLVAWNVAVFGLVLVALGIAAYGVFNSRIYASVDSDLRDQEQNVLKWMPEVYYFPPLLMQNHTFEGYQVIFYAPEYGAVIENNNNCTNPFTNLSVGGPCLKHLKPINADALSDAIKATKGNLPLVPGSPIQLAYDDLRTVTIQHQPWRVLTFAVQDAGSIIGIYQVARVASGESSAVDELKVLLFGGGIIGLLLTGLAGLFLAGRSLVPIRQAFARQRQFTADASHELRTPLALIRANAEMLYRHTRGADEELVGEIIRETDHLNRLVGDLLTLARADADSLRLESRPVDFRALVTSVHEDLHAIAAERGVSSELALNGPVTVQGDEGRLRQLLLILLDNALKYTDPGGRVDVVLDRRESRARLVVADTGIGIPAADQEHIFDRFYRVDRAREHESGGTGLGLAIARWIVLAHHGSIRVESESGKGARFEIDLPAV